MEVCFLTSGQTLTVLDDELQGQRAKAVKKALAAKVGLLDPAPAKIQLVVLEFYPPDDEATEQNYLCI